MLTSDSAFQQRKLLAVQKEAAKLLDCIRSSGQPVCSLLSWCVLLSSASSAEHD